MDGVNRTPLRFIMDAYDSECTNSLCIGALSSIPKWTRTIRHTNVLSNLGTAHSTTIEGLVERVSNMMG